VNERLVTESNKSLFIIVVFSGVSIKRVADDQLIANGVKIQIIINIILTGKRIK
jgi:hypothetical protein